MASLPARVRRPKDNGKFENGLLVVTLWVPARLRQHYLLSTLIVVFDTALISQVVKYRQSN